MSDIAYYSSPLGQILLEAQGDALTGLWFVGQSHFPQRYMAAPRPGEESRILKDTAAWLDAYFAGKQPDPAALRLCPQGSEFRRRVWDHLYRIPYGQTATYGQIAKALEKELGRKMSAQAVGGAVGHNPISIIIPCHRVFGTDGSLTGYAGGLERKRALLELENIKNMART